METAIKITIRVYFHIHFKMQSHRPHIGLGDLLYVCTVVIKGYRKLNNV